MLSRQFSHYSYGVIYLLRKNFHDYNQLLNHIPLIKVIYNLNLNFVRKIRSPKLLLGENVASMNGRESENNRRKILRTLNQSRSQFFFLKDCFFFPSLPGVYEILRFIFYFSENSHIRNKRYMNI